MKMKHKRFGVDKQNIDDILYNVDQLMHLSIRIKEVDSFFNAGELVFIDDMEADDYEVWKEEFNIIKEYFIKNEKEYEDGFGIDYDAVDQIGRDLQEVERYVEYMLED